MRHFWSFLILAGIGMLTGCADPKLKEATPGETPVWLASLGKTPFVAIQNESLTRIDQGVEGTGLLRMQSAWGTKEDREFSFKIKLSKENAQVGIYFAADAPDRDQFPSLVLHQRNDRAVGLLPFTGGFRDFRNAVGTAFDIKVQTGFIGHSAVEPLHLDIEALKEKLSLEQKSWRWGNYFWVELKDAAFSHLSFKKHAHSHDH